MASIVANHPINMTQNTVFYGDVTSYSAAQITIIAGTYSAQYLGNFNYDAFGNVFGQLTGYVFKISGVVQYTVSGMSTDAYQAFVNVQSGNILPLYERALSGNDVFTGSS